MAVGVSRGKIFIIGFLSKKGVGGHNSKLFSATIVTTSADDQCNTQNASISITKTGSQKKGSAKKKKKKDSIKNANEVITKCASRKNRRS
jgi:hypothetical protein